MMRAQKCTEGGFRARAEAQELPSRYRPTRTPAQCLHPPFHSATDWPEPNQTKTGSILPFGRSATTLTLRFHLPSPGKRNKVPTNRVPIFHHGISPWIADCVPPAWHVPGQQQPVREQRGDTALASRQGGLSSALPCWPGTGQQDRPHYSILQPEHLGGCPELCVPLPTHVCTMSISCSCPARSSVYSPVRTQWGEQCLSNSRVVLKNRQVTCRKRI